MSRKFYAIGFDFPVHPNTTVGSNMDERALARRSACHAPFPPLIRVVVPSFDTCVAHVSPTLAGGILCRIHTSRSLQSKLDSPPCISWAIIGFNGPKRCYRARIGPITMLFILLILAII